jgi:DNA-binding transcriptional ArsR family regulator
MTAARPVLVGVVEDRPLYRAAVARVLAEAPAVEVGELAESVAHFAEALSISVRTVRSHLDRIRDKTGRRRRSELTRLAIEEGIVGAHGLA